MATTFLLLLSLHWIRRRSTQLWEQKLTTREDEHANCAACYIDSYGSDD